MAIQKSSKKSKCGLRLLFHYVLDACKAYPHKLWKENKRALGIYPGAAYPFYIHIQSDAKPVRERR